MSLVKLRKLLDNNRLMGSFVLMSADTARELGIDVDKLPVAIPERCGQCYFCDGTQYEGRAFTHHCDYPDDSRGFDVEYYEEPPARCPLREIAVERERAR